MSYRLAFGFGDAIAGARSSIEACVIVGGSLFFDHIGALNSVSNRGIPLRFLFPSPRSKWLHSFAERSGINAAAYSKKIFEAEQRVARLFPSAELRWYEAPGPCWFTIIDRAILYTKPFSATRETIPAPENRAEFIEYYANLFDQLWERSTDDFRKPKIIENAPSLIKVVSISPELIARLAVHPEELSRLTPEKFELLIADRLIAMGLGVERVGSTNMRDGGVDMIAWPERNAAMPYLLAVQAKHSQKGHTVSPHVVRDLKGVISTNALDIGLIVTNTKFSADAEWAAREKPNIIRLRDFQDLVRWLRMDFTHEVMQRDLPRQISLGPGITVSIPTTNK
jgi:hypothetical protein